MSEHKIVTKAIMINAPASTVWKTITDPVLMKQWMYEGKLEIISGWEVGSAISIHGKMGDFAYKSRGTILEFEPEKVFQYTYWNAISGLADTPENYSVLEFRLTPGEAGTMLVFKQWNFPGEASFEHSNFYWNVALEVLKRFIEK